MSNYDKIIANAEKYLLSEIPDAKLVGPVNVGRLIYGLVYAPSRDKGGNDIQSGYYLVGQRGAVYALWRNQKHPNMMFPMNPRGTAGSLEGRWFKKVGDTVVYHGTW